MLMLSFCEIYICHIMGDKIRVDATLRLGHWVILEGYQGQMIFSSMFMFDRFEISGKPHIESQVFSLHLPSTTKIFLACIR